jgi:sporulation protein YlmC with PRC-barrel domain
MKSLEKENITGTNHTGHQANNPLKFLTASSVLGNKIYNLKREHLGKIHDIMLNLHDGRIEYAIIEHGGFLKKNKFFAVAFELLTIDPERRVFVLDLDKTVLKSFPGFDKDHWPDTNFHRRSSMSNVWRGSNTVNGAKHANKGSAIKPNNTSHEKPGKQ